MRTFHRLSIWIAINAILLVSLLVIGSSAVRNPSRLSPLRDTSVSSRLPDSPSLILWAWERPEDLRYINPDTTAVAFLSKTLYLRNERLVVRPRLQPLLLPPATKVIPVVRVESDRKQHPVLSRGQINGVAAEIAELARFSNTNTLQIDFDATVSEREFYRDLLIELRRSLPSTQLSITALASWCDGDNWLEELPIDEAVPMMFRMGIDRNGILSQVSGGGFKSGRCQTSLGISTDEPVKNLPIVKRLYVFNPDSWTANSIHDVLEIHQR